MICIFLFILTGFLKLEKLQSNPELCLTKCQTSNKSDNEEIFEDLDDGNMDFGDDSDFVPEKLQNSPKPEKDVQLFPHFTCKYCPMTLANRGSLEKHMKAIHESNKSRYGHKIKACEYCGAMMSTRTLSSHKRSAHGIGKVLPSNLEIKKKKRCEICGKLISIKNVSFHRKFCSSQKDVKKYEKIDGEEDVEMYLIKKDFKCEKCGMCFVRKCSLVRHLSQNEMCRKDEKNITEMKSQRIIKCPNNCGESFTWDITLKRHLKDTCKMRGGKEESNKVDIRVICDSEMSKCTNAKESEIKEERVDI